MKFSFTENHLLQALNRFDNQHLPLDLFLSLYFKAHKSLGSKDRAKIMEAVYGMCRWRLLIDHLIGSEQSWEKRYTLYKTFQPTGYLYANQIPLHIRVSCPKELFTMLIKQYGEKTAINLAQVFNSEAPVTVRANLLKTTRDELFEKWKDSYDVSLCKKSPCGIKFAKRMPFVAMPEYKEGLFEVQDEASQLVAFRVDAQPGQHVLDFCSGAGGKSLAIAPAMSNQGQIYLHDIRPLALKQARKRLARAGIQNVHYLTSDHPQMNRLKKKMDWVLVDAPCTGMGTLRRNPDMKWKFSEKMLYRLVGEQRKIFEQALSYLKPGGTIVYATCSLLKQENEEQVAHFLENYKLKHCDTDFASLPHYGEMDGFFAASFTSNP